MIAIVSGSRRNLCSYNNWKCYALYCNHVVVNYTKDFSREEIGVLVGYFIFNQRIVKNNFNATDRVQHTSSSVKNYDFKFMFYT
jgi:hypothetical protein